jgi:hypothetical protein
MQGVHLEDLPRCTAISRAAFEARQPFHLEFRVMRADTSYAWVHANGVPQYLLDGSFVGYVGSLEEISREESGSFHSAPGGVDSSQCIPQGLCHIAASFRQSALPVLLLGAKRGKERRALPGKVLLKCLELSVIPMVVVDKGGRALYCNRAFQAFAAGGSPKAGTGSASNIAPWPNARGQLSSSRETSAQAAQCPAEVQAWVDSDPAEREQDTRVVTQTLTIGGSELTILSVIDIGRESRTRLLERAFLHDLINAAGSIQMLIDLLTGGASRRERAEYLKLLQVSIDKLLSEIYHEAMMLEGSESMPPDSSVRDILTTLAEYYRKQPLARNCRIQIEDVSVEHVKRGSLPTSLFRVLDNMLRNAIEATSQGGVVTLGCHQIGGDLEFWVHNPNNASDSYPDENLSPSFTIDGKGRETEKQETNLLHELCGGTVSVSCGPEFGTTYSVRYPAASETISAQKRYRTKHAS